MNFTNCFPSPGIIGSHVGSKCSTNNRILNACNCTLERIREKKKNFSNHCIGPAKLQTIIEINQKKSLPIVALPICQPDQTLTPPSLSKKKKSETRAHDDDLFLEVYIVIMFSFLFIIQIFRLFCMKTSARIG